MVKVAAATLLLAVASVQASPLWKRQSASGAASSVVESASALSSSASEILSSALASASAVPSESAGSASASASASGAPVYPAFPCPEGLLTYVQVQQAYPGVPLETAVSFLSNWASGVPFPIVNSTGTNETGATRTYTVQGLNISEVLTNQSIDATTGTLSSDWNLTSPIATSGLTIYSAANHLEYYTNTTSSESTASIYSNFCASDQPLGVAVFEQFLTGFLVAAGAALAPSGSGVSSGAVSSGVVSSAASAASSAPASIASGASSVLGSATSGALSSATGVLSSAESLLTAATSSLGA